MRVLSLVIIFGGEQFKFDGTYVRVAWYIFVRAFWRAPEPGELMVPVHGIATKYPHDEGEGESIRAPYYYHLLTHTIKCLCFAQWQERGSSGSRPGRLAAGRGCAAGGPSPCLNDQ